MGQVLRMLSYDYSGNRRDAITALRLSDYDLKWYRLDDGVMGGLSLTQHETTRGTAEEAKESPLLHFCGQINTNGGGFCSIRSEFPRGLLTGTHSDLAQRAIKLRYRGDGKTYKVLLSDGTWGGGGPMARTPSWQADLPTTQNKETESDSLHWEEVTIPLNRFLPSFGGGRRQQRLDETINYELHPHEMKEIGLMLSLRLSNGQPNPVETFGQGIFPFSLRVQSIEFLEKNNDKNHNSNNEMTNHNVD